MKKIFSCTLTALLVIIIFASCDNDEIGSKPIEYDKIIFPEPCTIWGGTVADVIEFMGPYGFSSTAPTPGNANLADGTSELKYFKYYSGANIYDDNKSRIVYKYCFNNLDGGLKSVRVELIDHSQFKLDDVSIQLKNSGYHYDGLMNSEYYLFSDDNTTIRCYLSNHSFVFAKKGDTNELVWN